MFPWVPIFTAEIACGVVKSHIWSVHRLWATNVREPEHTEAEWYAHAVSAVSQSEFIPSASLLYKRNRLGTSVP